MDTNDRNEAAYLAREAAAQADRTTNAIPKTAARAAAEKLVELQEYPGTIDEDRYARRIRAAAREVIYQFDGTPAARCWLVVARSALGAVRRTNTIEENQQILGEGLAILRYDNRTGAADIFNYRGADHTWSPECICATDPRIICFAETHED